MPYTITEDWTLQLEIFDEPVHLHQLDERIVEYRIDDPSADDNAQYLAHGVCVLSECLH